MRDGIISETKNSRILKSDLPATYEELRALMAETGLPVDLILNQIGWSQLPTFLSKGTLLSDLTEEAIWENAQNRTVDAALKMLADVAFGRVATLKLTVLDTGGKPIPDVAVQLDRAADVVNGPLTDAEGKVTIGTNGGTHTLNLLYPTGYSSASSTEQIEVSGTKSLEIKKVSRKAESTIFQFTKSQNNFRIARFLSPIDFHLIGGGGSGSAMRSPWGSDVSYGGGSGGASGYFTIEKSVDIAGKLISVVIGAGGPSVSCENVSAGSGYHGKTGGATTLKIGSVVYKANGGAGGRAGTYEGKSYNNTNGENYGGNWYKGDGYDGEDGDYLFRGTSGSQYAPGGGGVGSGGNSITHGSNGQGEKFGNGGKAEMYLSSSDSAKSEAGGSGLVAIRKAV